MPTHTAEAEGGIPGYRDHHSTSGSLRGIADGEGLGGFAAQEGERMPALVGGCRVDDDVGRADHTLQFCCRTLCAPLNIVLVGGGAADCSLPAGHCGTRILLR